MIGLAFDTETTGLPKHPAAKMDVQPRMIEFGGVLFRQDGTIIDSLVLQVNPEQPLEAVITKITGLTDADLADKPTFGEVLPQIEGFVKRADVSIAHNHPFDATIVDLELRRLGREDFPWPKRRICTVQEYAPLWGRRPKLVELYQHVMGKPLDQTHRALDDVEALVEILVEEGTLDVIAAASSSH